MKNQRASTEIQKLQQDWTHTIFDDDEEKGKLIKAQQEKIDKEFKEDVAACKQYLMGKLVQINRNNMELGME